MERKISMNAESMNQKTAVFSFGALEAQAEPRSYDMDEPTRELPLIAGRFAGREWDVEDLQREYTQKKARRVQSPRRGTAFVLGGLATACLLIGSLMGQAKLVDINQEAVAVTREISALRQEQNDLRVRTAASGLAYSVGEDRREMTGQLVFSVEPAGEDVATVLSVRRGHELQHFWNSFVDVLGESFR